MNVHANTSSAELIEYLRDVAIRAKAKPAWIDAIDRLQDADKWESEAEIIGGQLYDLKKDFNEVRDTLSELCAAVAQLLDAVDPDTVNVSDVAPLHKEALAVLEAFPAIEWP